MALDERCDWLQQPCLMNIFQHIRFRWNVFNG